MSTPSHPTNTAAASTHSTAHSNRIGWGWWVLAAVGGLVTLAIVVVALVGAATAGKEIDPNQMFGALLTFLAAVAALIIPKLNAVGKNTSQTAEHVVNSHGTRILRDDIDEIKSMARLSLTVAQNTAALVATQARDITGMRDEIGQIRKAERDQWEAIEDTAGRVRGRYPKENQ